MLVDNHSRDDSIAFVRERYRDPRIEILALPENLGWSGGQQPGHRTALWTPARTTSSCSTTTPPPPPTPSRNS
ncbi:MAG: hypothetical protein ACOX5J_10955 [Candidatus Hydrogenedentales bacterium]